VWRPSAKRPRGSQEFICHSCSFHQIVKEPLIGLPAEAGPPIATARGRSHKLWGNLDTSDFSCPVKGGEFPELEPKKATHHRGSILGIPASGTRGDISHISECREEGPGRPGKGAASSRRTTSRKNGEPKCRTSHWRPRSPRSAPGPTKQPLHRQAETDGGNRACTVRRCRSTSRIRPAQRQCRTPVDRPGRILCLSRAIPSR